jgi:hypothetical protein
MIQMLRFLFREGFGDGAYVSKRMVSESVKMNLLAWVLGAGVWVLVIWLIIVLTMRGWATPIPL